MQPPRIPEGPQGQGGGPNQKQMEKTLATNPISTSMLQMAIDNLERAWSEFKTQHHRLCIIAGRGQLQGLQAYHATLLHHYWVHIGKAEDTLEEEQAKEAALKKSSFIGRRLRLWSNLSRSKLMPRLQR